MKVYHATQTSQLDLDNRKSRYGSPMLFFTTNKRLAMQYKGERGNIFEAEIQPDKIIDFDNELSYSIRFRNLIYKLKKSEYKAVLIENVFDRANSNLTIEHAMIMVVFDFSEIKNITLCTS